MEVPRRGRAIGVWAPAGVWKMRTGVRLIWNSKDWAGSLAAAAFSLRESSNTSSRVKTRGLSSFRRPFICEDCNCWRNHRSGQEIVGSEGSRFRLASWGWLNLAGRHPAPRNPGEKSCGESLWFLHSWGELALRVLGELHPNVQRSSSRRLPYFGLSAHLQPRKCNQERFLLVSELGNSNQVCNM